MLRRLFGRNALTPSPSPNDGRGERLAAVTVRVDDESVGWGALSGRPHDYDAGTVQVNYQDALTAWRKNPIAWRTIAITTDYVVGDRISISSPNRNLNRYIQAFWQHSKNNMGRRLEPMSDELSRAGDLFVLLFRNPQDGMSYIRLVTKDRIQKIETAPNDWETELVFYETQDSGDAKAWYSPDHPQASEQDAVMLHYAVNRPAGALMGEGDLTTMIPWLQRYSRMVEDRVRLNWAVRAFLWIVTVPANRVQEKKEQYRNPPESGSIIVKDESEKWEPVTPLLRGGDASKDLQAVRAMIDAGSGFPPHWRGDAGDISLATAQAMQAPTERHLRRRQQYFVWMLEDVIYHGYQRSVEVGRSRPLPAGVDYERLFTVSLPDISRWDNASLAESAKDVAAAFYSLSAQIGGLPENYARQVLRVAFKFMGEPLDDETLTALVREVRREPPVLVDDASTQPKVDTPSARDEVN